MKRILDRAYRLYCKARRIATINIPFSYTLTHNIRSTTPQIPYTITEDIIPTKDDVAIAERLLEAYKKAENDENSTKKPVEDIWTEIQDKSTSGFLKILEVGDPEELAEYLCNMSRNSATHGLTQGRVEYDHITRDKNYQHCLALFAKDKLVSLAEAIGAIPIENPEQGRYGENIYEDTDELIRKIEKIIGIELSPPPIEGGLFKITHQKGEFCFRDLTAAYTAWRIKNILTGKTHKQICEIGGGIGKVAYYCYELGLHDYTLIDLPYVNVLQGYYLLKTLPSAKITLYGEYGESRQHKSSIKVYPYWAFHGIKDKSFAIVHNQDSFPEIDEAIVKGYLSDIKQKSKHWFMSINQESRPPSLVQGKRQLNVPELISKAGGFKRVSRSRFWLREGYTEELYEVG
jgi:hypothetical protein